MLNSEGCISFCDLFSICLRTIAHLNMKLWIFSGHTESYNIGISKVQDFENFELSPMFARGCRLELKKKFTLIRQCINLVSTRFTKV